MCVERRWKYAAMAALLQSQSVLNINLPGIMALSLRPSDWKVGQVFLYLLKQGQHFDFCNLHSYSFISIWQVSLQLTIMELKYVEVYLIWTSQYLGHIFPEYQDPVQQLAMKTLGKVQKSILTYEYIFESSSFFN